MPSSAPPKTDQEVDLVEAVEALLSSDWSGTVCDETRADIARLHPRTVLRGDQIRYISFTVEQESRGMLTALEYRFGPPREITTCYHRVNVWRQRNGREVRLETDKNGESSIVID